MLLLGIPVVHNPAIDITRVYFGLESINIEGLASLIAGAAPKAASLIFFGASCRLGAACTWRDGKNSNITTV